jgi:hypothetical protein
VQSPVLPTDNSGRYVRSRYLATPEEENLKPKRDGLCVVGMNFSMSRPSDPCDPDSIRMNAMQTMYQHVRVWGVSQETSSEDTPTWKRGDVRSTRFWKDSFPGRNTKLVVIDYRWCPPAYWDPNNVGLGYGDKWFVNHIPLIFEHGGLVCILPNDTQGKVWGMYERYTSSPRKGATTLHCAFLSACQNPLYRATSVAWYQSNGASWTTTNVLSARANFSHNDSLRYCDATKPFIACYDATSFKDTESVTAWLDRLAVRPRHG